MIRGVVLALVAAAAVASTITNHTRYEPTTEYVYRYEVITTSALHASNHQTAGLKISTDVHMRVNAENTVTLWMSNPTLCRVNREVPSAETVETVFEHFCTPITGQEADVITRELERPIVFRWENGMPTELRVADVEPVWSINIKRGLLNLLNLNMKETGAMEALTPEVMNIMLENRYTEARDLSEFYRTFEEDIVGECETLYFVDEDETTPNTMFVSKVHNYDNCKTKPMFRNGLLANFADVYPTHLKTDVLTTQSHADYHLLGNRDEFIVNAAYLTTHFSLSPINEIESAFTCTKQSLKLMTTDTATTPISLPAHMQVVKTLKMEQPSLELTTMTPTNVNAIPWSEQKIEALTEMAETLLREVASTHPDYWDTTITTTIEEITKIGHGLPYSNLKKACTKILTMPGTDIITIRMKEIILDILPTLTRTDILPFIWELRKEEIISTPRTIIMINLVTLTVKPSPKTFHDLMLVLEDPIVTSSPMMKKTITLTAGILANKITTMYEETNTTSTVMMPELHKISQKLMTMYTRATTLDEKMEVIAMFGNAGLIETLPELEKLIREPTTPEWLRIKAIFALRRMTTIAPVEIKELLLPVFTNPTHTATTRIAAFLVTMEAKPCLGVFQMVAEELKKTSSIDVLTFVTEYLKKVVASDDPKMHDMKIKVMSVLETVQTVDGGFLNSGFYNFEKTIESFGPLGAELNMILSKSGLSPIPDNVGIKLAANIFGKKVNFAEFGLLTSGLKDIFWNIMGPENRFMDFIEGKATLEDFLLPLTELASKIIGGTENINTKFTTTDRELVTEKIMHLYTKLFNYELMTLTVDDTEIIELLNTVKAHLPAILTTLHNGYPVNFLRTISLPHNSLTLPTACGIPVTISMETVAIFNMQGRVQLEGLQSWYEILMYKVTGTIPNLRIHADVHPRLVKTHTLFMGTHLPTIRTGATIKVDMITKFNPEVEITINPTEKKITMETVEPTTTDTTLVMLKVTPTTMYTLFPVTITPEMTRYPITSYYTVESTPVKELRTPVLGTGFGLPVEVVAILPSAILPMRPETWFMAPSTIELNYLPTQGACNSLVFEMMYDGPGDDITTEASSGSHFSSWLSSSSMRSNMRTTTHDVIGLTFDPITHEADMDVTTLRQMVFVLRTVGGPNEKEMKIKLAHMLDTTWMKHLVNFQVLSPPLMTTSTSPIKVTFNTIVNIPDFITKFVPMVPVVDEPATLATAELKWGITNTVNRLANIVISWKPVIDTEMTPCPYTTSLGAIGPFHLAKHVTPTHRDTSVLQGVMNATLTNKLTELETPAAYPLNLTTEIDFEWEQVPETMRWMLPLLHQWTLRLPSLWYDEATVFTLPKWNTPNIIRFTTIVEPLLEELKMTMELPTQTNTIYSIPLPAAFLFKNLIHPPVWPLMTTKLISGDIPEGWCTVSATSMVNTFDLLNMELPETLCGEVVLVKDCSPLNLFMITMKTHVDGHKIITVMLPGQTVEFDLVPYTPAVKVNGELVTLPTDSTPFIITEPTTGKELFRFIAKPTTVIMVSMKYGLLLQTSGTSVAIKPSELWRGQLCGACGDMISSLWHELRGPTMELHNTAEEFLTSYTIPTTNCGQTRVNNRDCTPVNRNVVIERFVKGTQSICVSITPINQCSGSCLSSAPREIEMAFHCMPASLPSARMLRNDAENGLVNLSNLSNMPGLYHETIREFTTCAPVA